jgi:hypothetical protein
MTLVTKDGELKRERESEREREATLGTIWKQCS